MGAGAGFTALSLAKSARRAIATDITPEMLVHTRVLAVRRRLANVEVALAAAFDLVACRLAAHHFRDVPAALSEFRRATKPGGRLVICDTVSPEDEAVAAYMHHLECRRDPTHVRNLAASTWRHLLTAAGLRLLAERPTRIPQEFEEWVARAGTPSVEIGALRRDLVEAPPAVREAFGIRVHRGTIRWAWDSPVFLAVRET